MLKRRREGGEVEGPTKSSDESEACDAETSGGEQKAAQLVPGVEVRLQPERSVEGSPTPGRKRALPLDEKFAWKGVVEIGICLLPMCKKDNSCIS